MPVRTPESELPTHQAVALEAGIRPGEGTIVLDFLPFSTETPAKVIRQTHERNQRAATNGADRSEQPATTGTAVQTEQPVTNTAATQPDQARLRTRVMDKLRGAVQGVQDRHTSNAQARDIAARTAARPDMRTPAQATHMSEFGMNADGSQLPIKLSGDTPLPRGRRAPQRRGR
jgi:hypothetical protein